MTQKKPYRITPQTRAKHAETMRKLNEAMSKNGGFVERNRKVTENRIKNLTKNDDNPDEIHKLENP